MELKHLRYFVAVAEAGHITRAAARLGMQQPPLSQQIRALEKSLGTQLFDRHPKGVTLTGSGEMLLADSRRLLEEADAVKTRMRAVAAGHAGVLTIGFTSSAAAHIFTPRVLRECRQAYPHIALQIGEDHAAGLTEALATRKLHCAFLRVPVAKPPGVVFETLLREPVLAALPDGHALLAGAQRSLKLEQLRDERFILVRQSGAPGLYANLLSLCEQQGFTPQVVHEVGRMTTALSLVAAGEGVTVVPASMQGVHPQAIGYRLLKSARSLDAPLTLAFREADYHGPLRSFIELVRQSARRAVEP
ncbi:LysR family transcriptional regulator [Caenimonas koreensis]|uniref:LysR family transcriptional regulator n=1 Tax=Caenimonas koreensis DSM 17982 TaxID=1121255 RepID=A0A844B4C6_9BURK|nr:LysR family transcriptional regulator [Caenimonas koreensis]MRD46387.1 LysR family transcriptional regulator [Caenimonas koreensis DSM 17982]